ncbi:MAG: thermonuclease family protein [Candidatus Eremiobacteraeota bacterium]|nr:thermonuclease family protein [Candidatus Eremiobacteraeota bacterium]
MKLKKLMRKPLFWAVLILFLAILYFWTTRYREFTGKVVRVADGDTILVMHDGKEEKVRLLGIDCPELNQPYGYEAKRFTARKTRFKTVKVKYRKRDKYKRTLGWVKLPDNKDLSRELLKAGLAWWYRYYSKDKKLGKLENEARKAKRGLWQGKNPIPPWDWRRGKR